MYFVFLLLPSCWVALSTVGIQNRASHLHIPEPEVASLFRSSSKKSKKTSSSSSSSPSSADIDIDAIEKRLKRAKREKPKSVEIYNQIANYWRIKGDTQAIAPFLQCCQPADCSAT